MKEEIIMTLSLRHIELLSSKICHDLISPVSAINNGVEIVEEMGADDAALSIIADSAQLAQKKLKFLRMAYGMGSYKTEESNRFSETKNVIHEFFDNQNIKINWLIDETTVFSAVECKIILNILILLKEALPKGGILHISKSQREFFVLAEAERVFFQEKRWAPLLNESYNVSEPDIDTIQTLILKILAEEGGSTISVNKPSETEIKFSIHSGNSVLSQTA